MASLIRPAAGLDDVAAARTLFQEYQRALGVDLCFQGFAEELAGLPGEYAPPRGRLLLAESREDRALLGCVALRPLDARTAEMKRLFLRPAARGQGVGRRLVEAVMAEAETIGYACLRLDTLPSMRTAIALYRELGFREIEPYCRNPVAGALFLERAL